jgi:hypothetical protein
MLSMLSVSVLAFLRLQLRPLRHNKAITPSPVGWLPALPFSRFQLSISLIRSPQAAEAAAGWHVASDVATTFFVG